MKLELLTYSTDHDAIKKQYRDLAKNLHPDKPTGSKEKFQQLQDEYNFLMNGGKPSPKEKVSDTKVDETNLTPEQLRTMFNDVITTEQLHILHAEILEKVRNSKIGAFEKIALVFIISNIAHSVLRRIKLNEIKKR